jgi:hypothetical protein
MKIAVKGQRVYEYVDDDGVVYYSFTKRPATLSPPVRLRLRSQIGTHLANFLSKLRQVAAVLGVTEDDG